jgi:cell shape-determining protein MreC
MAAALVLSLLGARASNHVRGAVLWAFTAPGDGVTAVADWVRTKVGLAGEEGLGAEEARRLEKENDDLREAALLLEEQIASLRKELSGRNAVLRAMRGRGFACNLISARVVLTDSLPYGSTRQINVGTARGVQAGARATTRRLWTDRAKALPAGLAALSTEALVGRIDKAWAYGARLRLVTDEAFQMRALVLRRLRTPRKIQVMRPGDAGWKPLDRINNLPIEVWIRGDGAGIAIRDVPAGHNVLPGDRVVTRADESFLPYKIRIGKVVEVREQPDRGGFTTLRVRPAADLDSLRNVYVVYSLSRPAGRDGT